jgi:GNAT superfamily N-acetyltransferase
VATHYQQLLKANDDPLIAYLDSGLALVAEHPEHGVVGGLIAYPPVTVVQAVTEHMLAQNAPREQLQKLWMLVGVKLTRIKTVAVVERVRGEGIGGSLLDRARRVYFHCGFHTVYGAMPDKPGLTAFYQRAGFTVCDQASPVDLSRPFGMDFQIWPSAGERLFHQVRPNWG